MIEARDVKRALEFHGRNARTLGNARERLVLAERRIKRVTALVKRAYSDKPAHVQEREAFASDEYEAASVEESKAAGDYEYQRAAMDNAKLTIEIWRTLEANHRAAAH